MQEQTVSTNAQEAIDQINANMAAVLDFQNRTSMALISPGRRVINQKCWQVAHEAIQGLQR